MILCNIKGLYRALAIISAIKMLESWCEIEIFSNGACLRFLRGKHAL